MKPKNKRRIHHEPDSSSDSDTPLVDLRDGSVKNVQNDLFKYSVEKCEFCDKIFNNKYNMLVHNTKHIIIPLLNQKLHKCSQCNRLFNSIESLEWHSVNSHACISDNKDYLPQLLQSFVQRQPIMVLTKEPLLSKDVVNGDTRMANADNDNVPEILKSMVLKQPVTVLTKLEDPVIVKNERILQSFVKKEPVTLLKKETFHFEDDAVLKTIDNNDTDVFNISDDEEDVYNVSDSDNITISDSDDDTGIADLNIKYENEFDNDFEYDNVVNNCDNSKTPKIKDRILFEDDDDDFGEVSKSETSVHTNTKENYSTSVTKKDPENVRKNTIILGNKPNVSVCNEAMPIDNFKSVHNDELKKPGLFRCKKCSKMFPNRFEAIVHETTHLSIKRKRAFVCRYCDWYVATSPASLVQHKYRRHPEQNSRKYLYNYKLKKCEECKLSFVHRIRHRQNYHHEFKCSHCGVIFQTRKERSKHKRRSHRAVHEIDGNVGVTNFTWMISSVQVCEFCFDFLKDRSNIKYQFVKTCFKMGERLQCERCKKLSFELKVVRMKCKRYFNQSCAVKESQNEREPAERKLKKPMSNADRLKNVQQRLKKLKALNKF